jgi:hypothetical protein
MAIVGEKRARLVIWLLIGFSDRHKQRNWAMPFDGNASQYSAKKPFYVFAVWRDFLSYVNNPKPTPEPMPVRILRDARGLIANERHWAKGNYEVVEQGVTRRCAVGALRAAARRLNADQGDLRVAYIAMIQIANKKGMQRHKPTGNAPALMVLPPDQSVERVNDRANHAFVMKMFDDSIARYQSSSLCRHDQDVQDETVRGT